MIKHEMNRIILFVSIFFNVVGLLFLIFAGPRLLRQCVCSECEACQVCEVCSRSGQETNQDLNATKNPTIDAEYLLSQTQNCNFSPTSTVNIDSLDNSAGKGEAIADTVKSMKPPF